MDHSAVGLLHSKRREARPVIVNDGTSTRFRAYTLPRMENALGSRAQRPTHYRQQAGQLREMAKTAPAGKLADQLFDLAAQYERLAERLEPVANPSRIAIETELYRSSNGDQWYLVQEPGSEQKFIRHQPNAASGGKSALIAAADFLAEGHGPQHEALLRLIGSERPTDKRD